MNALTTTKLTKHFAGTKALDELCLEFEHRKITGLIGPNGSGKTTLINIISNFLQADSGEYTIHEDAKLNSDLSQTNQPKFSRTFQNVRLFDQMTVLDNIILVLNDKNFTNLFVNDNRLEKKATNILKKIGLRESAHKLAGELSYGQRKLLEIGRVLASNSQLILLDEPFAGLFPQMIETVKKHINTLKLHGKTVILIEHNIQLIRELCDRVTVLNCGKSLASGETTTTLSQPEVLGAYLGK
ncbi:MAG TPA: ATP-binding cassette domain-containing protein [Candidatus Magasanikbacteria bacterium]|nr:ATP-binding cassette domain-containing protein [Candidatus Magasanikbacteria bacterium]